MMWEFEEIFIIFVLKIDFVDNLYDSFQVSVWNNS